MPVPTGSKHKQVVKTSSHASANPLSDIQQMMYAFGDGRRPHPDTAIIVQKIVMDQAVLILHRAADVAHARGSKTLCFEDVLFLMKNEPVKVQRLVKYLTNKEVSSSLQSCVNGDISRDGKGKIGKRCQEFLEKIDSGGRLMAAFREEYVDQTYIERLVRNDQVTRGMDDKQYEEYCTARKVSFRGKYSLKFQENLQNSLNRLGLDQRLDKLFFTVMCYLAYETVGQLVETGLTVRQDTYNRLHSGANNIEAELNAGQRGAFPALDKSSPLNPAELREAVRRLQRGRGRVNKSTRGPEPLLLAI